MKGKEGILLESGTNEVEILEFELAGQGFGVNVLKVQAIEQFTPEKVTEIQLAHPAVIGSYQYRDRVISLINLGKELQIRPQDAAVLDAHQAQAIGTVLAAVPTLESQPASPDELFADGLVQAGGQGTSIAGTDGPEAVLAAARATQRIVLVLEFNEQTSGFLVDGVNRIHRVSGDAISPLSPYFAQVHCMFMGSLSLEQREVLVVDMERILSEILPGACKDQRVEPVVDLSLAARRAAVPLLLAEDSVTIRNLLIAELGNAGYSRFVSYDNGLTCWQAVQEICDRARSEDRDPRTEIGAVISDIEMPLLDGMTLCRKIKQEAGLGGVPVILFSSLINDQIALKCKSVGADAHLSKPRFSKLVEIIDQHVLSPEKG